MKKNLVSYRVERLCNETNKELIPQFMVVGFKMVISLQSRKTLFFFDLNSDEIH